MSVSNSAMPNCLRGYPLSEDVTECPPIYVSGVALSATPAQRNETAYRINGDVFLEDLSSAGLDQNFVEFEVYAKETGKGARKRQKMESEYDMYSPSPTDSDAGSENEETNVPLKIVFQKVPSGCIINSDVFLSDLQWNTLISINDRFVFCAVCDLDTENVTLPIHVATPAHERNLDMWPPLDKYDLSITRRIRNDLHCGVCNQLFSPTAKLDHFNSKMHAGNLLFATNKVSDIFDSFQGNGDQFNNRQIQPNANNNKDNASKNECYYFNVNNIREPTSVARDFGYKNPSPNYENDMNYINFANDYDDDFEYEEPEVPITGISYAKMAKTPKVEIQNFIEIELENKKVKVKFDSWHMIINPMRNKFYCMMCKKQDHIRHKLEHCREEVHLGNLQKCQVVEAYEEYFIRQVDDKLYHCGHCNNLQLIHDMVDHVETSHPRRTRLTSESKSAVKPTPVKKDNARSATPVRSANNAPNFNQSPAKDSARSATPVRGANTAQNFPLELKNVNQSPAKDSARSATPVRSANNANNASNAETVSQNAQHLARNALSPAPVKSNAGHNLPQNTPNHPPTFKTGDKNDCAPAANNDTNMTSYKADISGILGDIVIYPFGCKMVVPVLSYNVVCKRPSDFYCGLCDVLCAQECIKSHILDLRHILLLQRTPFVVPFKYHLIRAIRDAFHCTICNIPVTTGQVMTHLQDVIHIGLLIKCLKQRPVMIDRDASTSLISEETKGANKNDVAKPASTSPKPDVPTETVFKENMAAGYNIVYKAPNVTQETKPATSYSYVAPKKTNNANNANANNNMLLQTGNNLVLGENTIQGTNNMTVAENNLAQKTDNIAVGENKIKDMAEGGKMAHGANNITPGASIITPGANNVTLGANNMTNMAQRVKKSPFSFLKPNPTNIAPVFNFAAFTNPNKPKTEPAVTKMSQRVTDMMSGVNKVTQRVNNMAKEIGNSPQPVNSLTHNVNNLTHGVTMSQNVDKPAQCDKNNARMFTNITSSADNTNYPPNSQKEVVVSKLTPLPTIDAKVAPDVANYAPSTAVASYGQQQAKFAPNPSSMPINVSADNAQVTNLTSKAKATLESDKYLPKPTETTQEPVLIEEIPFVMPDLTKPPPNMVTFMNNQGTMSPVLPHTTPTMPNMSQKDNMSPNLPHMTLTMPQFSQIVTKAYDVTPVAQADEPTEEEDEYFSEEEDENEESGGEEQEEEIDGEVVNQTFDSVVSEDATFDMEEYVYLNLKNTYIKISNTSYNTLVHIGDGSRYCFVCSDQVQSWDLQRHVDSRAHLEKMEGYRFLDKYEDHLLRQNFLMYHCAICNVIVSRKDLRAHLSWASHTEQNKDTVKNVKKPRKDETKGVKHVVVSTQKEKIYLNEKEPPIKVHLRVRLTDKKGSKKEAAKLDVVSKGDSVLNRTANGGKSAQATEKTGLKKNKLIIFNDRVLKVSWEQWHGISLIKSGFKCNLCQSDLKPDEIEAHCGAEWHKYSLDKPVEKQYAPAIIRKINESALNCVVCNTELPNKSHLVAEHVNGKKHKLNYKTIIEESSQADTYADCGEDVFYIN